MQPDGAARKILHRRLTRRGLAPLAGVVVASFDSASAGAVALMSVRLAGVTVPSELIQSTVRAAGQVAAGKATAQVTTGAVASLVQRMVWSMTMIKLCKTMSVFGLAGVAVIGVSVWRNSPNEPRPRPRPGSRSERVAQAKAKAPEERKSGPAHVVEPPDMLIVEVLEALPGRPISGERLVRPDGTITLGFYGDIHIAGLTLPEVKEKVIRRLQKYITDDALGLFEIDDATGQRVIDPKTSQPIGVDPKDSRTVFVDVTAYNSSHYYVEGDVSVPGRLPYTGNETVLDVIHFVNGLLSSADRSKIRLIRRFPKGSPVQVLPIDYEEITMGTDSSTNYQILPNDRLVVPRAPQQLPTEPSPARSSQARPTLPFNLYFPGFSNAGPTEQQLQYLRAVERHLSEVETKLDRILERMDRDSAKANQQSPRKSGKEPEGTRPIQHEPQQESQSVPRNSEQVPQRGIAATKKLYTTTSTRGIRKTPMIQARFRCSVFVTVQLLRKLRRSSFERI